MKTPLQKLIEDMEADLKMSSESGLEVDHKTVVRYYLQKMRNLLPEERQVIENAYKDSYLHSIDNTMKFCRGGLSLFADLHDAKHTAYKIGYQHVIECCNQDMVKLNEIEFLSQEYFTKTFDSPPTLSK